MFNIYTFEKKLDEENKRRSLSSALAKRSPAKNKMRDLLAKRYKKRVALFIKDMVTDPVKEHDEYCLKREHLRNTSMQMQGEKNFRFTNFRTEKDRIVDNMKRNGFFESAPNSNKSDFEKGLRKRDHSKELGPDFRYKAKTSVERVLDNLKDRIPAQFAERDIATQDVEKEFQQLNSLAQRAPLHSGHRSKQFGRNKPQSHMSPVNARSILPSVHTKTHFKGATAFFMSQRHPGGGSGSEDDEIFRHTLRHLAVSPVARTKMNFSQLGSTSPPPESVNELESVEGGAHRGGNATMEDISELTKDVLKKCYVMRDKHDESPPLAKGEGTLMYSNGFRTNEWAERSRLV